MDKRLFEECDEKCLRDEPAACTARCPVHVDITSLAGEIAKGDYKNAYKILEKRLPIAGIIAMICDHPCESACVRDMPIRISELEKAAVMYGKQPKKNPVSLPKKKGKVAVAGGGISGISAAFELDKKGYNVTIYERSERLGGRIWDFECISRELIDDELRRIGETDIKLALGRKIDTGTLATLGNEYDAVYLGTGIWEEFLPVAPDTFQVLNSSVFAGGRLLGSDSVIESVSTGKRAAISIERYTQKISMTASRDREGSFETPMRYNTHGIIPLQATELTGTFYTKEEAAREAGRCLKCRCDECIKACAHLRKYDMAPKAYARQILINDDVIMGTRYANTMINSCAMCGLCGEQCPQGIDMGEIVREARASMTENGKMPPSAHDFALRDMEFCSGNSFFMVKNPPETDGGSEKAVYMFYPGCQLPASCPEHVEKAYHYLLSNKSAWVGLMLGCCGAPADWAGHRELALENVERIRGAWEEAGKPVFILACTSCMSVFERYLPEINIVSLWEIINDCGLPAAAVGRAGGRALHIHDACGARYNNKVQDSIRHMITDMGYQIKELVFSRDKTKCCGYGGMVFYANRTQTKDFVNDICEKDSNEDLIVYCAMCKDLFANGGKRTYHILDLIFAENPEIYAMKKMPGLSDRRANRAGLKRKLLRELWNESADEKAIGTGLSIPQTVLDVMEERLILLEDVEDVLEYSRRSGQRFLNEEDNSFLAGFRKKNVTYWARWTEKEDGAHIINVYSHRMAIS
jgi:glutamate synthase (NADPH) small chain